MWKDTTNFTPTSPIKRGRKTPHGTWLLTTCLSAAMLLVVACEQPLQDVAGPILPDSELREIRFTDTLALVLSTERVDSINTYRETRQLVGNYVDPQLGRITATTYTEVLARADLDFGEAEDIIFDSLVLRLAFDGAYGDTTSPISLQVYELDEIIPQEDLISSELGLSFDANQPISISPANLQLQNGVANLSIRLDDELGLRLLFASVDTLSDRDLFLQLLKGLCIATTPVEFFSREPGAIYQLATSSDDTQLELHYRQRNENATAFQPKIEPFVITSSTPRFHQIVRSETEGKLIETAFTTPDTDTEWECIQGASLIQTAVQFPNLETLGEVGINRAELILPVATTFFGGDDRLSPPIELFAIALDENGQYDITSDDLEVVGDQLIAYDSDDQQYTIVITRYIQQIVSGQRENNGLVLLPSDAPSNAARVILGGMGNEALQPELNITYSTLRNE